MTDLARPRLREGVETVVGMDDHTLLLDTATGTYHRLGRDAVRLVAHLDGVRTTTDIAELMRREQTASRISGLHVDAFVEALHGKALLEGDEPVSTAGSRASRGRLLPRFIVSRGFHRLLAPVAAVVGRLPARPAALLASVVAALGYAVGLVALAQNGITVDRSLTGAFLAAFGIQLVAVLLHESWHGIVAAVQGHPVRGLGVALMFWVAPVAYVDRTDSYRVRSRRGRVAIALAGIVSDGWVCGATGLVALGSDGWVQQVTSLLLTMQLLLLVANLNPFAPSDTVAAVEAGTGLVDVRGRAFDVLRARLGLRPMPPHLQRADARTVRRYLTYAVCSVVFAAVVVVGVVLHVAVTTIAAYQQAV